MLLGVVLGVLKEISAGVEVGEGANAEAIGRMKLRLEELATSIADFV